MLEANLFVSVVGKLTNRAMVYVGLETIDQPGIMLPDH
jgi:hypothetical protein